MDKLRRETKRLLLDYQAILRALDGKDALWELADNAARSELQGAVLACNVHKVQRWVHEMQHRHTPIGELGVRALRELAASKGIKGYMAMKKPELLSEISQQGSQQAGRR